MDKHELRIVFMGTPDFAVPTLEKIVKSGFNVVAVITAPDRLAGRGRKINESAVKTSAKLLGIPILQPVNLKSPEFIDELKSYKANLQIVVAFRMLPEVVWAMPQLGTFNLHASLLPQYRGAAPINFAIINGENKTGITTFFLEKEIDTGKTIKQQEIDILPDDNAGSLHDKLMVAGADLVVSTIDDIINGNYTTVDQNSGCKELTLKPAPKISKAYCLIDWNNTAVDIHNKVRGLSPYPTAFGNLKDPIGQIISIKIFNTKILNITSDKKEGTIISDNKSFLHVCTYDKQIEIRELQIPGKKRMTVKDALMGFRNISECIFISD